MEWLTLAIWTFVLLIALPLGRGMAYGAISLGVQAMAAGAGFALLIVYVIADEPATLAWVAAGLAVVGVLAVAVGAMRLTSERESTVSAGSLRGEEHEAGLAGVQLPLFMTTLALTIVTALGIGTSS